MSTFSDVDASPRPQDLIDYLDQAHSGLHSPKQRLRQGLPVGPGDRVLDLGCGAGHELAHLEEDGILAVGIDTSAVMLHASRSRLTDQDLPARLARADGARLPFRDGAFDACRIERVLQHVADPAAVLAEARRVLRPGGTLGVSEPDWASFTLASADPEAAAAVTDQVGAQIAQRAIGRQLRRLLVDAGFGSVRIEVELAVYRTLEELDLVISLRRAAERACAAGQLTERRAAELIAEQRDLSQRGGFHATLNRSVLAWAVQV
ncbi:methyltransferase domain-containing protein [Streptacidiphilus sp. N1-3]|uniref:Methyltransferase domain-containing protein n=1 Tax=Streptacidiphilus alkalitolerans TaxID=3342712 RepID=A0ABV6WYF2_9ACTN